MNEKLTISKFLSYVEREAPVDDVSSFDPVEAQLGRLLPADYKGFLTGLERWEHRTAADLLRLLSA